MTILAESSLITVEDFLAMPNVRDYELIDGQLVKRQSMGARASYIAGRISTSLGSFADQQKVGWLFDSDTIYRYFGPGHTGRRFDLSFIRFGRLHGERIPDADIRIAPDLGVEVVSPNDLAYEVHDKVVLYMSAGVQLIWLVYPETRSIEIARPDGTGQFVRADQELTGENVLPGFRAKVSDFFPPMENVETTGDAVT